MNPMEEIFKSMSASQEMKFISGNEREAIRKNFNHVEDLKEGDVLQWKRGMKNCKFPAYDQTVEVFNVFPVEKKGVHGTNHSCDEDNFSILVRAGDELYESAFDSRRFERVQD
jgi:hypothetical protein